MMTFFDFCSGIGAGRLGLERAGMKCVGYSEISRSSIASYKLLHDTEGEKNYGNLTKINPEELPEFDLLIAGFPCQTFSVIGRQEGFNDKRGQIIFHIINILKARKIKYCILENVKGLTTHDKGKTLQTILKALEDAGYLVNYKVLTSMNFGVPQMRQRVYFVGVRKDIAPKTNFVWGNQKESIKVSDLLISDDNEISMEEFKYFIEYLNNKTNKGKYTLEEILKKEYAIIDTRQSDIRLYFNRIPTLRSFRDGLYYVRNGKLRSLTGYEALLIQGFPRKYADRVSNVSDRDLLRQAGNAMTVGVIEALGRSLIEYLSESHKEQKSLSNDTLIGVVKSKEQYNYCVEKQIYYTYLKTMTSQNNDIRFVAMYQPKSAFGFEQSGVYLYGEVEKIYEVKRSQIHFNVTTNKSNCDCVVYKVKNWIELDKPILPSGNARAVIVTNNKKLFQSSIYTDLLEA